MPSLPQAIWQDPSAPQSQDVEEELSGTSRPHHKDGHKDDHVDDHEDDHEDDHKDDHEGDHEDDHNYGIMRRLVISMISIFSHFQSVLLSNSSNRRVKNQGKTLNELM